MLHRSIIADDTARLLTRKRHSILRLQLTVVVIDVSRLGLWLLQALHSAYGLLSSTHKVRYFPGRATFKTAKLSHRLIQHNVIGIVLVIDILQVLSLL